MKNTRYWIPSFVWMLAIFLFSTDLFSMSQTASVIERLLHYLFPTFSNETVVMIHVMIRKLGHILAYALLGFCYSSGFTASFTRPANMRVMVSVVVLSFMYACLDEWHQSFSMVRTASFGDVLYDTAGAIISQVILLFRKSKTTNA